MHNLLHETVVSLGEAAKLIASKPHRNTVQNWATKGVGDIFLESCMVGGRRLTSTEAVRRFIEKTSGRNTAKFKKKAPRRRSKRQGKRNRP